MTVVDGQDLPAVDEVRILRLRPGDTVVVYRSEFLDDDEMALTQASVKEAFPDNVVVVMEGGSRLEVLRRDDDEVK